jgi:hypothetical protein
VVKELRVTDPNEGKFTQEREEQLLHELVYLGIELPEELVEQRRERLGWVPADRDPRSARNEKQWTAYLHWLDEHQEVLGLTPGGRLALYAETLKGN